MNSKCVTWFAFVGMCFVVGAIGRRLTATSVKTWYPGLVKPAGTPPPWVFGPVWSVLYLLMGTAAWLVWQSRYVHDVSLPLLLFLGQLIANAGWSFIFFALRKPGLALVEILFLLLAIVLTAISFSGYSLFAVWLMAPYASWVAYASYLNLGIWRLNRGTA